MSHKVFSLRFTREDWDRVMSIKRISGEPSPTEAIRAALRAHHHRISGAGASTFRSKKSLKRKREKAK